MREIGDSVIEVKADGRVVVIEKAAKFVHGTGGPFSFARQRNSLESAGFASCRF